MYRHCVLRWRPASTAGACSWVTPTRACASIIGPSWIGHGSRIRAGAQVVRSILFEYTRIGAGMCFSEMIISPTYCVDRHGETQYRGDEAAQLRWGDARG